MRVFRTIKEFEAVHNAVVTIGTFDGVHLGHRQVLEELKQIAQKIGGETLVITFWPHPRLVLSSIDDKPKLLNTLENKIYLLEELGIENLLIIPFDKAFSQLDPETYIRELLANQIHAKAIVIGYDHRFGQNRSGSFAYLKENADKYGYQVFEVAAFQVEGLSVSSTKIRTALKEGNMEKVNRYLGYHYFLEGVVVKGMSIGSTLNFPTANIRLQNNDKLLPKDGVYVVKVELDGQTYYGMLNSGINPSIEGKGRSIEVHIFGVQKDLYNSKLRISFLKHLRDELKFNSLPNLIKQLEQDRINTLAYLKKSQIEING